MFSGCSYPPRRVSRGRCWGDDGPVRPIERYLAYLTDIERSPNTVKAYAHDLKDWFVLPGRAGLDWREVRLEDVGEFVAWLRLPLAARDGRVAVLPSVEHHCGGIDGEPQAFGGGRVLHARRPQWRRSRRAAGDLAARRAAGRVEAVPASHQQGRAAGPAHGRVEGAAQAAAGAHGRRRCRRSWTRASGCGTGSCSRCCTRPGCSPRVTRCGASLVFAFAQLRG